MAPEYRTHEQIFEIEARPAEPCTEVVEEQREPGAFTARCFRQDHFRERACAEQVPAKRLPVECHRVGFALILGKPVDEFDDGVEVGGGRRS